jgi:cystathionine beta-lyase/cystathionine gamma-synthase
MSGPGGMISFEIDGGLTRAQRMLEKLTIFACAESLGGVESLAEHPASMTHASIPPEIREQIGISDGLVRLSVGLEAEADLWADIETALASASGV